MVSINSDPRKSPFGKILGAAIIAVSLSACQAATSKHAGEGEIFLSASSANHAENYLKNPDGAAFAVSTDGYRIGWVNCPHSSCAYKTGSPEGDAIKLCEKSNKTCKALLLGQQIVWRGPVRVTRLIDNSTPVSLRIPKGTGGNNYTGKATLSEDRKSGKLYIKNCTGDFDSTKEYWQLTCKGVKREGSLAKGIDSLYWGKSGLGGWEISIEKQRKMRLEEAIMQHNQSELVLLSPTKVKPSDSADIGADKDKHPAVLKWANVWGDFNGTIYHKEKAPKGRLTFSNLETGLKCEGEFDLVYGYSGNWNLNCSSDKSASGTIKVWPNKMIGEGKSKDGEKISFRLR